MRPQVTGPRFFPKPSRAALEAMGMETCHMRSCHPRLLVASHPARGRHWKPRLLEAPESEREEVVVHILLQTGDSGLTMT